MNNHIEHTNGSNNISVAIIQYMQTKSGINVWPLLTHIPYFLEPNLVSNWTRVNLPIQVEKFKSFEVSISTLSQFEPGWLWSMKLNPGAQIEDLQYIWLLSHSIQQVNLYVVFCKHFLAVKKYIIQCLLYCVKQFLICTIQFLTDLAPQKPLEEIKQFLL